MKQFLKINKHYFLAVLILASIFGCQPENSLQSESEIKDQKILDITAKSVKINSILKQNKNLARFFNKNFTRNTKNNLISSNYNFSIDTTKVQVISADTYESYTFTVDREVENENIIENYVLVIFENGSYSQLLVEYPYVINGYNIEYDFSNASANYLMDNDLLLNKSDSPCDSQSQEIIELQDNGCIAVNCGLVGDHPPNQKCDDGVQRSYWDCDLAWVVVGCVQTGGSSASPSSSNSSSGANNNDSDVVVIPVTKPSEEIRRCINAGFNDAISIWLDSQDIEVISEISNFLQYAGCNETTEAFIRQAIEAVINEEVEDFHEFVIENTNPDCESFNYSRVGGTNWQCASVVGVHELFTIFNWDCIGMEWGIFTQPLYFQLPINASHVNGCSLLRYVM